LACQEEFCLNNPLDVNENVEHALDFALHLTFLLVLVSLDFQCTAHAFIPERLSNHCQGLICTFSKICTKFAAIADGIPREIA
jgi:hypothetical protein